MSTDPSRDSSLWSSAAERERFYPRMIWAFPLVYALHITEEAPNFPGWVRDTLHGHMTLARFGANNAVLLIGLVLACAWASRARTRFATTLLFTWAAGQTLWNGVFHFGTTLLFHTYSPGVVTSVFLYIPCFLFLSYVAVRERFLSPAGLAVAVAGGAALMAFVVWAGLYHFGPLPCAWWGCT